jgi:hypothetical protein
VAERSARQSAEKQATKPGHRKDEWKRNPLPPQEIAWTGA